MSHSAIMFTDWLVMCLLHMLYELHIISHKIMVHISSIPRQRRPVYLQPTINTTTKSDNTLFYKILQALL